MRGTNSAVELRYRLRWLVAAALIALAIGMGMAFGGERVLVPQQSGGGPLYARIEASVIPHTDEWAAIAFYRDPACVPATFNLLLLFDVPTAFGCPLMVHGFEIYKDAGDMAPIQSKLQGNGSVPVWFVSWTQLESAVSDGMLTTTELLQLDSLVQGQATFFEETLHPRGIARQDMLQLVAYGLLEDGRSFEYKLTAVSDTFHHVEIAFK